MISSDASHYKILKTEQQTPYRTVELFAGAGGLALGLHNADLKCSLLVENDKHAAATLRTNKPDWLLCAEDIHNINFKGIEADVISGGFPCQTFSSVGNKSGFEDPRGSLFMEYARALQEIQPKVFVAENVRGLAHHDQGRTLDTILETLKKTGYKVTWRVLQAQYLDVPQKRQRLVILGLRQDLCQPFAFPQKQNYTITLEEALYNVPPSIGSSYSATKYKVMSLIPEGGCWVNLPEPMQRAYMGTSYFTEGGKTGIAKRLSWTEPSLTLLCSPNQKMTERCHPEETRPLTVREYARIQCFPDDWQFQGAMTSQYRQIGNAVPVNLGYHIGRCIVAMLSGNYDSRTMEIVPSDVFDSTVSC